MCAAGRSSLTGSTVGVPRSSRHMSLMVSPLHLRKPQAPLPTAAAAGERRAQTALSSWPALVTLALAPYWPLPALVALAPYWPLDPADSAPSLLIPLRAQPALRRTQQWPPQRQRRRHILRVHQGHIRGSSTTATVHLPEVDLRLAHPTVHEQGGVRKQTRLNGLLAQRPAKTQSDHRVPRKSAVLRRRATAPS